MHEPRNYLFGEVPQARGRRPPRMSPEMAEASSLYRLVGISWSLGCRG